MFTSSAFLDKKLEGSFYVWQLLHPSIWLMEERNKGGRNFWMICVINISWWFAGKNYFKDQHTVTTTNEDFQGDKQPASQPASPRPPQLTWFARLRIIKRSCSPSTCEWREPIWKNKDTEKKELTSGLDACIRGTSLQQWNTTSILTPSCQVTFP